jgi:DNA-binding transcriptional regulator YiaG
MAKKAGRKPGKWTAVTPEEIRAFREQNEISRSRLAGALGVSSTTIQNWETGNGVAMPRLQKNVAELIKAGPSAIKPAVGASVSSHAADHAGVAGPQVMAAATIVSGYLQTSGSKFTTLELLELIKNVRGALV